MKLLLDECLPVAFRNAFSNHIARTVEWAGLKGRKNGDLLSAATAAGYDVLITVDQGLPRESRAQSPLAVVVIRSQTNQLEDLLPLVPAIESALDSIRPGQVGVTP